MQKKFMTRCAAVCAATTLFHPSLAAEDDPVYLLDKYVVSSGPVARNVDDFVNPFAALDSTDIQRRGGATLGALLGGQAGVNATSFGAGASRPVIRGFDGPRVRILDSGIEASDVSSTSPDHAVAVEPMLIDRVEIIRGPATLLYGSSAIGGVVNVIGREIPRERVDPKGYSGAFESRYGTASDGETFLGYSTAGGENWALRITGLTRDSENYDIPGDAEIHHETHHDEHEEEEHHDEHEEEGTSGTLESSFVETDVLSIGGTWFFGEGNYFGAAVSLYESFYGVPGHSHAHGHEEEHDEEEHHDEEGHDEEEHGEEGVAIDLERKRFDAELVLSEPMDWIEAARFRFGFTDYEHTELEGSETGTVFKQEGWDFRGEAANREWAFIDEGVIGIQVSDTDFSAVGDEAFTPPSETQAQAVFTTQHMHRGDWHYEFGGRLERQSTEADGAP
ncbi:MAG TPA: TonB-dependent receptor plug domain-containing protein, partial [Opitutales bacterium]|nr:TonB-dependent receptor plug domain-containing protein [Opitutales bacterium]